MSPLHNAFDALALDTTVQGANTRLESIAALLQGVIDAVTDVENNADVETLLATANLELADANTQLGELATLTGNAIQVGVDGNDRLDTAILSIDGSNTRLDGANVLLADANDRLDGLQATLATIAGHVDTLEGLTDGLEGLVATTNTELAAANATLALVAGYVDGLEGFTDGVEASLTSIDGRLAAPLVVGEARTTREARARTGVHFAAGSGRLTLAAAGSLRGTISNPAGSGKRIYLYRLAISATAGPSFAKFRVNPTSGLPASAARPVNNVFMGHPNPSAVVLKADTSISEGLGGGVDTGIELGIFAGYQDVELPPYLVPAGVTLGLGIDFAGPVDLSVTAYWWEEAA